MLQVFVYILSQMYVFLTDTIDLLFMHRWFIYPFICSFVCTLIYLITHLINSLHRYG